MMASLRGQADWLEKFLKETYNDLGLSSFLTLSVGVQLFALCCLRCRVAEFGGVQGLSQKSLIMQCFVYGLRLCSSSWLRGYVPVDGTGDGLYQGLDLVALLMAAPFSMNHE